MTIVCFGELLLRLNAPGRELLLQRPHLDVHVGGAEANVAVGLANLGHRTKMVSAVPDSALGRAAIAAIRGQGVDCAHVQQRVGRMGLYFMSSGAGLRPSEILYDRGCSSFAATPADAFDWDDILGGARLLHLSGITPAIGPEAGASALHAAKAAKRLGVPVSFDGNYRAALWESWDSDPQQSLAALIGLADILFGNHRDIGLVLGREFSGDGDARRREAAAAAFAAFPDLKIVASTARHVVDADNHRIAARVDTRDGASQTEDAAIGGIVDRIGTGDAFAAGVLHALLNGEDRDAMARDGLILACLKHSLPGDSSRFTRADLAAFGVEGLDVRR